MKADDAIEHEMSAEDFGERAASSIKDGRGVILIDFDEEHEFSILSNFQQTEHILAYLRAAAVQAFLQAGYDFFAPGIVKEATVDVGSTALH